jgi:polar amino acid transport system substrate-binding protein
LKRQEEIGMKKLIIAAACLFALQAQAQEMNKAYHRIDKSNVIRCGAIISPPFYEYDAKTKEIKGLLREVMDTGFGMLGWKVTYTDTNFGDQPVALQSGKVDAVCGDGPWSINMIKYVDYSMPLLYIPMYAIVREEEARFATLKDLDDPSVTFAGLDGDSSIELAQKNFPKAKIVTMPAGTDPSSVFMNVVTKKADVIIWDPLMMEHFLKTNPKTLKILEQGKPITIYPVQFSISKDEPKLRETINNLVAYLHNSGQMETLMRKYDPNGLFLYADKPYREK